MKSGLFLWALGCLFGLLQAEVVDFRPSKVIPWVGQAGRMPVTERPIVLINAGDFGAIPGDDEDDYWPLSQALNAIHAPEYDESLVVLQLEEGVYDLSNVLWIDRSQFALRGMGSSKTTIRVSTSLREVMPVFTADWPGNEAKKWSWRGGFLWVQSDVMSAAPAERPFGIPIETAVAEGETFIPIPETYIERGKELVGEVVCFFYLADMDWLKIIYGDDATFADLPFEKWPILSPEGRLRWRWTAKVLDIKGSALVLDRPLRTPIYPQWEVSVGKPNGMIEDVHISRLSVAFDPESPQQRHLDEHGRNAIFFLDAVNCLVDDVVVVNADNAFTLEGTSHSTLRQVGTAGERKAHHGIYLRSQSHDNLLKDFDFQQNVRHGLSFQDLSSGNVFSTGRMRMGTLDSHRGLPFDNVRTDIDMSGIGRLGGAWGPLLGRRIVNWNIRLAMPDEWTPKDRDDRWRKLLRPIIGEQWYVSGAIVGIQGADPYPDASPSALPEGPKGTIVAAWGTAPEPPNLFEAQKNEVGLEQRSP